MPLGSGVAGDVGSPAFRRTICVELASHGHEGSAAHPCLCLGGAGGNGGPFSSWCLFRSTIRAIKTE